MFGRKQNVELRTHEVDLYPFYKDVGHVLSSYIDINLSDNTSDEIILARVSYFTTLKPLFALIPLFKATTDHPSYYTLPNTFNAHELYNKIKPANDMAVAIVKAYAYLAHHATWNVCYRAIAEISDGVVGCCVFQYAKMTEDDALTFRDIRELISLVSHLLDVY